MMTERESLLIAAPPKQWARAPEWLSFSVARDIEQCPRRASLRRSQYEDVWPRIGYPPRFSAAVARGTIVHNSVERLVKALALAGCTNIGEVDAITELKKVGGFSAVIRSELENWLTECSENPRLNRETDAIRGRLEQLIPEMRLSLQVMLRDTQIEPTKRSNRTENRAQHGPLYLGTYIEVELRHETILWRGVADVIRMAASGDISILDFKTGDAKEQDVEQLTIYALLWARDKAKNPDGKLATQLLLHYLAGSRNVAPPDEQALNAIEAELQRKAVNLRSQLDASPPIAIVSNETCSRCDVRHLCDAYWSATNRVYSGVETDHLPTDWEVQLVEKLGYSTWRTSVISTTASLQPDVLTVHFADSFALRCLGRGDRIRIMDCVAETDEETLALTIRGTTEVFRVDEQNVRSADKRSYSNVIVGTPET